MKKLKLKSKDPIALMVEVYSKLEEGWQAPNYPKKSFWGYWKITLEKSS